MSEIICSGALFYAIDNKKFLFLHRAKGKHKNVWGLVGGLSENQERPWQTLEREIVEEIGEQTIFKAIPLETFVSVDNKFSFHTYLCLVHKIFLPNLNEEHDGFAWVSFSRWPKPLHYGLKNTLEKRIILSKLETVLQTISLIL